MLIGISVSPEVFSTKNIIIGLLAVSLRGLRACSPSIAFNPNGVASIVQPQHVGSKIHKDTSRNGMPFRDVGEKFGE